MLHLNWNKYNFRQCLVGVIVTIDVILVGAGYTFSATLLPHLENEDSTIHVTRNEETWIASISSLTCIPGTLLGGMLHQFFGCKWAFSIISFSNALAWGLLSLSTQVSHLLLGRAFQGLVSGLGFVVGFCFMSEVVDLKYRSILLNMMNIGCALGMLFVDLMGSYYAWQISAYVLSALAVTYFLILLYLKNTHVWYLHRGNVERAKELYFWYKDDSPKSEEDFRVEQKIAQITITYEELLKEWKRREFLVPFGVVLWFNTTVMCTGGVGISLYSVEIMRSVVSIDEYMTTVITDILRLISTFGINILLKYTSVRFTINLTSILCSTTLLLISLSLYLKDSWSGCSTIALISIWTFNFFFNLGYINLAIISMGELFTGIGKSSGTTLSGMLYFGLFFACGQLVPMIFDNLGHVVAFLMFGCFTIVGGTGLFFIMPETRGVSNEQIRLNFQSKTKKCNKTFDNI